MQYLGTDELRQILALAAGLACAGYLLRIAAALLLVAVGRAVPEAQAFAVRFAPRTVRPLIRRALVGGLLGAALGSAGAWAAPGTGCADAATGVPVLDRAGRCAAATAPPSGEALQPSPGDRTAAPPSAGPILVEPGDSLWSISQDLLGKRAAASAVASAWPRLWDANRALIGSDPALIRPGMELVVPHDLAAADHPLEVAP